MEEFQEEMIDARYDPALLNIHVFFQGDSRTNLEAKLIAYNSGPVMWELKRFVAAALAPLPPSWKMHVWPSRYKPIWEDAFERLGHNFESHYKPSRKAALHAGGDILLDPMIRQDYTVSTPLLISLMLECSVNAATFEDQA